MAILAYKVNFGQASAIISPSPKGKRVASSILPSSYTDKIASVLMVNFVKFQLIPKPKSTLQMSVSNEIHMLTYFLNEPPLNTDSSWNSTFMDISNVKYYGLVLVSISPLLNLSRVRVAEDSIASLRTGFALWGLPSKLA